MYKADNIAIDYQKSEKIQCQGDRNSIKHFIRQGYKVAKENNGFWVLSKPSKVMVTVDCGLYGKFTYNMKESILELYRRDRISEKLLETFKRDFVTGKIYLKADDEVYDLKWNR